MNFLSQTPLEQFNNKTVLVRVDFNVPIQSGIIFPDEASRIHAVAPTIEWLQNAGAKIILMSHIGRSGDSLQLVADYITHHLPQWQLTFCNSLEPDVVHSYLQKLESGQCVLLENVRTEPGEESNSDVFAGQLAQYADYYINDAFAVCHRNHASVVGIPKHIPGYAGLLIETELHQLQHALRPHRPAMLIMAGIKFETKLPLIQKLLPDYESVLLGGGLLNTYLLQSGYSIGKSVFDTETSLDALLKNDKILIPEELLVDRLGVPTVVPVGSVLSEDTIVDVVISPEIKKTISNSETVVWNGPLGWYEKGFVESAKKITECFDPINQISIVGGGDTVALLKQERIDDRVTFLSTGGGAMLEYLEQGTLPGLAVLK